MNRKFFFGCGCLFLLLVATIVIGVYFFIPRVVQKGKSWVSDQMSAAGRRSEIEAKWTAPSGRPDPSWFPAAVDGWTLSKSEAVTFLPEIKLERPGYRAQYRSEKQDLEVAIVPVAAEEQDVVLGRARDALIDGSSSNVATRLPGRLYVRVNGDRHTRLWWLKDWLFVFYTVGPEDPDAFAEKFLSTMAPAELEKR